MRGKSRQQIEAELTDCSRKYFVNGDVMNRADELISQAFGHSPKHDESENGQELSHHAVKPPDEQALAKLAQWGHEQLQTDLSVDQLSQLSEWDVRTKLQQQYDSRYRPELSQAERALILDVLDTSWKDHLYYMDHLRAGIGLVGYAQKDPKVEYRREGMKAFEGMWDRIGQQVTGAIFRLEKESPDFVGSLWRITSTRHDEAASVTADAPSESASGNAPLEPGQESKTIDPIRNADPKVGRNDPCPCGSGKKYKKCCGA